MQIKIFKLENFIYFTIIALPLYLVKIDVGFLKTNVLEILIFAALLWFFAEKRKLKIKSKKRELVLFLLIVFGLAISTWHSGNYSVGLGIIKGWFLLPFLFALIAYSVIDKKENILISLYISASLVSLTSIFYLLLSKVTYDGRLEVFFNSPNYLAMYIAPAIIIAVYLRHLSFDIRHYKWTVEILFLLSFFIILTSLYFTYSYASWFSIALSLGMIIVLKKKFNKKYLVISSLIFLTLIFLLKDTPKFQSLISLDQRSSLASRSMIWESAEKILSDNWLWGIGPGNFQDQYLKYQKYFPPYLEWAVPHPHNLYLTFWLYGGIVSFLSFLALVFWWLKNIFSSLDSQIKYTALGTMVYILLHGLFDTTYFKNDLSIIFWLVYFLGI